MDPVWDTVKDGHLDHINDDSHEDARCGQQEAASEGAARAPASIDLRLSSSRSGVATQPGLAWWAGQHVHGEI
jgi:hypothetical protein